VTFRKPGMEATETVRLLRRQKIVTAARAGWVRTSPHFYISPQEIDRMIDALP
jgi:selenocysteine lyase/cysteine desulfurase